MDERVKKTVLFLDSKLKQSDFYAERPYDREYRFDEMPIKEKREFVEAKLQGLSECRENPVGTPTAYSMWTEKVDYQIGFYHKLLSQIDRSCIE